MAATLIRAKIKDEHVADVENAAKTMFAAINEAHPAGVRYASYRLDDGVTYVIVLDIQEGIDNPLPSIAAFRAFQEDLKGWLAEPPTPEQLTAVGAYPSV